MNIKNVILQLIIFITLAYSCKKENVIEIKKPTIVTSNISNIGETTVKCGGNITSEGGSIITESGVCWNTATTPTIANNKKTMTVKSGVFSLSVNGLLANTTYYLRAFAANSEGYEYGNQITFKTLEVDSFAIGRSYKGGLIGYILQANDNGYIEGEVHGIIVAQEDISTLSVWGCWGTTMPGTNSIDIGTGYQNTINIINGCASENTAAWICGNLVVNGYSDWYLPSKDELNVLCVNRAEIGNFQSNFYWSSTSNGDSQYAWSQSFGNTSQYYEFKTFSYYVRAVRSF